MELRLKDNLKFVIIFFILFSAASSENDMEFEFCGTWRHGKGALSVIVNISTGCNSISVSANKSSLSIDGQITAQCSRSDVIHLSKQLGLESAEESYFCLYWEPLLDQLWLQLRGTTLALCRPTSLQDFCCTDLSHDSNTPEALYGIEKGMVITDILNYNVMTAYKFSGKAINCKTLCDQWSPGSTQDDKIQTAGLAQHPCAHSSEVEMKDGFEGYDITSPFTQGVSVAPTVTVHIPSALKQAAKQTSKVVLNFFKNNSLFQEGVRDASILGDVVEITVENEVITNLPEPIKIDFRHGVIPTTHSRKCVSWDTRRDPLQVSWLADGCKTHQEGAQHTECLCNHLTYFSILVQLESRPVCHLLALTSITSLGCAVSFISCVALIIYLCLKRKRPKEQSLPIHLGLAASFAVLYLLFFLTGVLANVARESVCTWVAAALHYFLLASFTWMGIEVFHTFWLVYRVFIPFPKPYVWCLVGLVIPGVPVLILVALGDFYGVRKVHSCEDPSGSDPYQMCWMKDTPKAWTAHYFVNVTVLMVLVVSGLVMLVVVYRQIRTRDEWQQNRVAFFSIWGLSCLFGTSWSLIFLDFGPLSVFISFLFTIVNSFQGFLLMLRFYMVDRMRRQAAGSALGSSSSTSTGSTRQHMLQAQEKC